MMKQACEVIHRLNGRWLATAESLTGGGIGAELTSVPGSSAVFKGGVISYTNWVKHHILGVSQEALDTLGAVSAPVARQMAEGARSALEADLAVAVTGLAGPSGDDFGHPVGTVFIGFADGDRSLSREYHFEGSREEVRRQTIEAALSLVLQYL